MRDIILNNMPWGIVAGLITLTALFALRPLASKFQLLDTPGGRKQHNGNVPLIGGISIYVTIAGIFLAADTIQPELKWLLGSVGLLVFIGFLDDMFDIKASHKLLGQVIAALIMCIGSGIYIQQIGTLPDGTVLHIGIWGIPLTIIAVVGVTNAFNFIDGIDGLAGLLAIIAVFGVSSIVLITGGQLVHPESLAIFRGAIGGYLLVNMAIITRRKVFLGDAGSMLIGFVVAWIVIYYSQLPIGTSIPTSMALWVLALPLIDTCTLIIRRVMKKESPFLPDREHLHHIFQRLGLSALQTLSTICIISILLILTGYLTYALFGDVGSFMVFLLVGFIYYKIIASIWKISSYLRKKF